MKIGNVMGETGKATVVAMLGSLTLIAIYAFFGRAYLQTEFPVVIDQLVFALIGVLTTFALGYGIHMALVGEKTDKQVKKEIRVRLIELGDFVDFANEKIKGFEYSSKFHIHAIRPIGLDSLSQSRRIIQALAMRVIQVNNLLNSKNVLKLIEAEELLETDLELSENCLETLIGSNPIAPIPLPQCVQRVTDLLDRVALEIDRLKIAA